MYRKHIETYRYADDYHGRVYNVAFYEREPDTGVFDHHYIARVTWQGVIVAITANETSDDFRLDYINVRVVGYRKMKIAAVNDYYDLVLTDDEGILIDAETFEQTDDIRDAYVARGIADKDPDEWERKAREACADAGFKAGALIEDGTEKWFEVAE